MKEGETVKIRCGFKPYSAVRADYFSLYVDAVGNGDSKVPVGLLLERVTFEQHPAHWGSMTQSWRESSRGPDFSVMASAPRSGPRPRVESSLECT